MKLKTGKFKEKLFWHTISEQNALFIKLPDNWAKKHKMITECAKNHNANRLKNALAQTITPTWSR